MSSPTSDRTVKSENRLLVALVPTWDAGEATRILAHSGHFVLGSDPSCDVQLAVAGVAPMHCDIVCRGGIATLTPRGDCSVRVNHVPVSASVQLGGGDMISAGAAGFRVEFRQESLFRRPGRGRQADAVRADVAPALPGHAGRLDQPAPSSGTGVDSADTREQNTALADWQQRLEERSTELDRRAELLTARQTQLLQSQSLFEQRAAQIEQRQKEVFQQLSDLDLRRQLVVENEAALAAEREAVNLATRELEAARGEFSRVRSEFRAEQDEERARLQQERRQLTENMDALQTRQEAFEEQIRDHHRRTEECEATERQLTELSRKLDAKRAEDDARRNAADVELAERESAVSFLQADLEEQAAQLNSKIAAFEEDRNAAAAELSRERERFAAAAEEQQADLDAQKRSLEERFAEIRERVAELEDLETTRSRVAEQSEKIAVLEAELKAVEAAKGEESRSLDERLEHLATAAEQLEQDREAHIQTVSEWEQRVAETDQRLAGREETLNVLEEQLRAQADAAAELSRQDGADHGNQASTLTDASDVEEQRAELKAWEAELQERHEEIADRVTQLKRLSQAQSSSAAGSEDATGALSVAESHQFAVELEEGRRQIERLEAERDELSTGLNELRAAFETVREELLRRDHDSSGEREKLDEIRSELASRDSELAAVNNALAGKARQVNELELRLQTLVSDFDEERARLEEEKTAASAAPNFISSVNEEALLQQIDSLRKELDEAQSSGNRPSESFAANAEQYESLIRDLTQQIEELQAQRQQEPEDHTGQQHLELISELKARLEAREEDIRLLESVRDNGGGANAGDPEELRTLHRELDSRTVVLDTREEELRERQRMVEQAEVEVESQRRELLEARQQLELARAEIQSAMEQPHPDPSPAPDVNALLEAAPVRSDEPEDEPGDDAAPKVRSELAELFGIGNTDSSPDVQSEPHQGLTAVDEYSQESQAAVPMSFADAGNVLLEPPAVEETEKETQSGGEEGDAYVARYMEQLLARNREKAGAANPEAPAAATAAAPAAVDATVQQDDGPKEQKSFIDAYLSGEYDGADARPVDDVVTSNVSEDPQPRTPRQKIDLDALRNDMDSFRQLSTKSVENALASHAKRQNRGGITARTTILTVLFLICLFFVSAAAMNVISFGIAVWISIIAVMVSGLELLYKLWTVNQSVRNSTTVLGGASEAEDMSAIGPGVAGPAVEPGHAAATGAMSDLASADQLTAADARPAEERAMLPETSDAENSPLAGAAAPPLPAGAHEKSDDEQYFEL